jgi:dTDP-4-dehydrorhamnose reductase
LIRLLYFQSMAISKILVTGAGGTIGGVLMQEFSRLRLSAVPWQVEKWRPDETGAIAQALSESRAEIVFHLALASQQRGLKDEAYIVNHQWPVELAKECQRRCIRLVFTSTVMVYSPHQPGPYTETSPALPDSDYGRDKLMAENNILAEHPEAAIVRLGWQIGNNPHGNQMLAQLHREHAKNGAIKASRKWYPACSPLIYTAQSLALLARSWQAKYAGQRLLLDANKGWTYYEICQALKARYFPHWRICPEDSFVYDQRMRDTRLPHVGLGDFLPELAGSS